MAVETRGPKSAKQQLYEFAYLFEIEVGQILWDSYMNTEESKNKLKDKINLLIPNDDVDLGKIRSNPTLSSAEKIEAIENAIKRMEIKNKKLKKIKEELVATIWIQRKYNYGELIMSIVFVILTDSKNNYNGAVEATSYSCHPLLRIMKCKKNKCSNNCCMIFIDEESRVYRNWNHYKKTNTLPEGILVAPSNGIYAYNDSGDLILEVFRTPASSELSQALNVTDKAAGVTGLTASALLIGSIFAPVLAPVVGVAAIAGTAVGLYSAGRSAQSLADRSHHQQSIGLENSSARANWLGVAGGAVSVVAGAATSALSRVSASGREVSKLATGAVDILNIVSIAHNGVSLGNGVYELINKSLNDEKLSPMDFLQLSSSLFLFTHSVYNFQTASNIMRASRAETINKYGSTLSNSQRKIFNKMSKESIRTRGVDQGQRDVIRGFKSIPDKKQYFSDIKQINKKLNRNQVRVSFAPDGQVVLNNKMAVSSTFLRENLQATPEAILGKIGTIPANHTSTTNVMFYAFNEIKLDMQNSLKLVIIAKDICSKFAVMEDDRLLRFLFTYAVELSAEALYKLVDYAKAFMSEYSDRVKDLLDRIVTFEEVLNDIYSVFKLNLHHNVADVLMRISSTDFGTRLLKYYTHLKCIVEEKMEDIVDCFQLTNLRDLKNCLVILFETLTEDAANYLLNLAKQIFVEYRYNMKEFEIIAIKFDQFLYEMFNLTLDLTQMVTNINDLSTQILIMDNAFLTTRIRQHFSQYFVRVGITKTLKCEYCTGSYTITNL